MELEDNRSFGMSSGLGAQYGAHDEGTPREGSFRLEIKPIDLLTSPLVNTTKGMKFDSGKLEWDLLPVEAVEEIIKVLMFGAKKYAKNNWKNVDAWESRYYNAAMRHMTAWQTGEKTDQETGISHLAHAGCCILFLLAMEKQNGGT